MSAKHYRGVLNGRFRELGYFADRMAEAESDYDFFRTLAVDFVPLIRKSPAFEKFYFQCIKTRESYYQEKNELEEKAPEEVKVAFMRLRNDLKCAGFLENSEIAQKVSSIRKIFATKHHYGMPSYLDVAYQTMCHLLEDLLAMENEKLLAIVKRYVTTHYLSFGVINHAIGKHEKLYIKDFIFASSLSRLHEMNEVFSWDKVEDFWVAWEFFVLVEWCWNTPFSFFDDKQLSHDDYQAANQSNHLLELHDSWCQISEIKKQRSKNLNAVYFQRKRFSKYLDLILHPIIREQAILNVKHEDSIDELDVSVPHSIEWKLADVPFRKSILILKVVWSDSVIDSRSETFRIHSFKEKSGPYSFFKEVQDSPIDTIVTIKEKNRSLKRYLTETKMHGIDGKLFFEKPENGKAVSTRVKQQIVKCAGLPPTDRIALARYIKTLKPYDLQN